MATDLLGLVKRGLAGELEHLRDELRKLVEPLTEEEFWRKPVEPGNSAGHLVLHLAGNLNYMAGACLGNTGYARDREREFTETDVPTKAEALENLDEAVGVFRRVVEGLEERALSRMHPVERLGLVLQALLRLVSHFALHRGQMSYIVRLVHPPAQ